MKDDQEKSLLYDQEMLAAIARSVPDFAMLPSFRKPRCGYNSKGQLISLDLSYTSFPKLPPELFQLGNLRILKLCGQQLRVLPPALFQLRTLKVLDLSDNHLRRIPPEVGQLHHLEKLHILWNRLQELPAEMGQLRRLQKLNLVGNQLRQVPAELGHLRRLQKLDLSRNLLCKLPAELAQLRHLHHLLLRDNPLNDVPIELKHMGNLKRLDLTKTPCYDGYQKIFGDLATRLNNLERYCKLIKLAQQLPLSPNEHANVRRISSLLQFIRELIRVDELGGQQPPLSVQKTVATWQEIERCLAQSPFPALLERTESHSRESQT